MLHQVLQIYTHISFAGVMPFTEFLKVQFCFKSAAPARLLAAFGRAAQALAGRRHEARVASRATIHLSHACPKHLHAATAHMEIAVGLWIGVPMAGSSDLATFWWQTSDLALKSMLLLDADRYFEAKRCRLGCLAGV